MVVWQKFENELRQKAVEKMMDLRARAETERSANVDYVFNATEQLIEVLFESFPRVCRVCVCVV